MNIYSVDLETSSLNADYGMVLCGCIKPLGKATEILRVDSYPIYKSKPYADIRLIKDIRDKIATADILVTYNGVRFDIPFLQARLLKQELQCLPKIKHIDLFYLAKFKLKIHSNSLDSLAKHLGCSVAKTHISGEHWTRAMTGQKSSLDYIVRHCVKDVQVLEEVFERTKGLIEFIK